MIVAPLVVLTLGGFVYLILAWISAGRRAPAQPQAGSEPVSILKPLAGLDEGLEDNLRSFFEQNYAGKFEILLAVRKEEDDAFTLARQLQNEYRWVESRLLLVGEPPYANAKVWSLDRMLREARHDLVVMADSDIRVEGDLLTTLAREEFDLTTCPYRAVGGPSVWSRLEAAGLNTEFIAGLFTARLVEGGVKFAVGPTIAARRHVIAALGGFDQLKDYLAEDFVMGARAAELGFRVQLSNYVVEHRIGSEGWRKNFAHRLRWNRSTRRSRPGGYLGQVFTNPLPWAVMLWAAAPAWWWLAATVLLARFAVGYRMAACVLRAPFEPALMFLQDWLSLLFWVAGFFGNTIEWRGRRYRLEKDGRFTLIA
jgi:ceramide glucosyltransferase